MARQLPQNHLANRIPGTTPSLCLPEEHLISARKWYFCRQEIENHSPSRKDGVDFKKESQLRKSYCSFLQELGMKLKVPQVTIASAMMVCHRFYMRQSHAKNDWQTIGTAGIFLACKIEETPRFLNDVVVVAYELIFKWDPSASKRIRQKEVFNKQKELILIAERLLLSTLAFDVDIQLPYKPLVSALKRLGMAADLGKVAWNFVNDWLCTTLCLEYKPHYIAAGSIFLASKFQKVKLPSDKGKVWWMEFDVSPKQLQEVIQQMLKLFEKDRKQSLPPSKEKTRQPEALDGQTKVDSSQSCISSVTISDLLDSHEAMTEANECNKSVSLLPSKERTHHPEALDGQTRVDSSLSCISSVTISDLLDGHEAMAEANECNKSVSLPPSKEKTHHPEALDRQTRVDSSRSCISSVTICDQLDSHEAMMEANECNKSVGLPPSKEKTHHPEALDGQTRVDSSQSCISSVTISDLLDSHEAMAEASECNRSVMPNCCHNQQNINYCISPVEVLPCQTSDAGSSSSAIETGICQNTEDNYPDLITQSTIVSISVSKDCKKINLFQIREAIKRRRLCRATSTKEVQPMSPDIDSEAWIEKELEQGIELEYVSSLNKKRKAS